MKFYHLLLCLSILALTSCSTTEISEEEALFNSDNLQTQNVTVNAKPMEVEVYEAVNSYRERIGLSKLIFNDNTLMYAYVHNQYMIIQNKISHDNFSE